MRVLIVEPDAALASSIELMLGQEGFVCDTTDLGEDALQCAKLYDYDIITLALALPDIDGFAVLRRLRSAQVQTPVLVLSSLGEIEPKVKALDFGADDYLTKPFDHRELIARLKAIVRRSKGYTENIIRTGELVVNLTQRLVIVGGEYVHFTPKEYEVLELLSLRKRAIVTRETIMNHLYGGIDEPNIKIVDQFVCFVRKKIALATGGKHYIRMVWGRGYALEDPEPEVASLANKNKAA